MPDAFKYVSTSVYKARERLPDPQIVTLVRTAMFRSNAPILIHSFDANEVEGLTQCFIKMNFNSGTLFYILHQLNGFLF